MFHALAPLTPTPQEIDRRPALRDPAVALCNEVWKIAYRRVMRREKSRLVARKEAEDAFLSALPPLSGIENIRSFVACVAFAIARPHPRSGDRHKASLRRSGCPECRNARAESQNQPRQLNSDLLISSKRPEMCRNCAKNSSNMLKINALTKSKNRKNQPKSADSTRNLAFFSEI
jgi:hypothetical protein